MDSEFRAKARLNGLQAGSDIYFDSTQFIGTALFTGIQVAGNTFFRNGGGGPVKFESHADFVDATLEGNADFSSVQFHLGANFRRADIGRLGLFRATLFGILEKCKPAVGGTGGMCPAVFTDSTFGGDADFMGAIFTGPAKFDGIVVKGVLGLEFAQFLDSASLDGSMVATALFRDDPQRGPSFRRPPSLRAFSFDRVMADWRQLLPRPRHGDLDTEVFSRFEKFYLSVGDQDKADEVYLERRRLRRLSLWHAARHGRVSSAFRWAWDYFVEYWLLNYGVPTKRLLGWSLMLGLLGVAVLATVPDAMTLRRQKQEVRVANGKIEFVESTRGGADRRGWADRWLTATGTFAAAVLPGDKATVLSQCEPSDQPLFPWAQWPIKQVISWLGYMISLLVGIALAGLGRLLKGRG